MLALTSLTVRPADTLRTLSVSGVRRLAIFDGAALALVVAFALGLVLAFALGFALDLRLALLILSLRGRCSRTTTMGTSGMTLGAEDR
jgi:hypothetical protein